MIKIISKKDYERLNNYKELNRELGLKIEELTNEKERLEAEIKNVRSLNFQLSNDWLDAKASNQEANKSIRKLKSLCTRNCIDYSHLFRKKEEK